MALGHGYIECDEVKAALGQDVYVHQNVLAASEANVGYRVQFKVHFNNKGMAQAAAPLVVIEEAIPGEFFGVIKSFDATRGDRKSVV